jgi:hypothetical protein
MFDFLINHSRNKDTPATRAATLAGLLTDPENHFRHMAADLMRYLNTTRKMAHPNVILSAATSTAEPLFPMDEEDLMHMAYFRPGYLLFSNNSGSKPAGVLNGSNVSVAPKNLLYPAIKAIARNPIGACRGSLTGQVKNPP